MRCCCSVLFVWCSLVVTAQAQTNLPEESFSIEGGFINAAAGSVIAPVTDADGDTLSELLVADLGPGSVFLVFDAETPQPGRTLLDNTVEIALEGFPQRVSLLAADLDRDGLSEIIIGQPEAGNGAGSVAIFYGRPIWGDFLFTTGADIVLEGASGDEAGASLAVAENPSNPGELELLVGAPGANAALGQVYRIRALALPLIGSASAAGRASARGWSETVDDVSFPSGFLWDDSDGLPAATPDTGTPTPGTPTSTPGNTSPTPGNTSPTPGVSPTPGTSPTPGNVTPTWPPSTPVGPSPTPSDGTWTPATTSTPPWFTSTPDGGTATPTTPTPGTPSPETPTPADPTPYDRPPTPVTAALSDVADLVWTQTRLAAARLGDGVSNAGDLDGDGLEDLAFAAPASSDGGEIFLLLSSDAARDLAPVDDMPAIYGLQANAWFGIAMSAAGDVDGDGLDDLLVGAPGDGTVLGQAFIVPGASSFGSRTQVSVLALMTITAEEVTEDLGAALTGVPDLNGDGRSEVMIGARGYANDTGRLALFMGRSSFDGIRSFADATYQFQGEAEGSLFAASLAGGTIGFFGAPGDPVANPRGVVYGLDLTTLDADADNDGFGVLSGDCDDGNAAVYPTAEEVCDGVDNNCDGALLEDEIDADGDGIYTCVGVSNPVADCDDANPDINPDVAEVCEAEGSEPLDNNCDGQIDEGFDLDGDGFTSCISGSGPSDCDDGNSSIHPEAAEVCDGIDNNCDGQVDEGFDTDSDGFSGCGETPEDCDDGDPAVNPAATEVCNFKDDNCDGQIDEGFDQDGDAYTTCDEDCDDTDATIYLGAEEVCDGVDNDCNSQIDEGFDGDEDGVTSCDGDCDDTDAAINPSATEACELEGQEPVDNNCDGQIDEGFDQDGDGVTTCASGSVAADCNDTESAIFPGNTEVCDGLDNDCNGQVDGDFDTDSDGWSLCGGDCDDSDAAIHPDAEEVCEAEGTTPVDNNCDGQIDEGFDTDGDGFVSCTTDCDDTNADINPDVVEICDAVDNNCDGQIDEGFDSDGDGFPSCQDCDDADPAISPSAVEICEEAGTTPVDNNCDGQIDEGFDQDSDGFTTCASGDTLADCDDTDAAIHPDAEELSDGLDNNCDGQIDEGLVVCDEDGDGYENSTCTSTNIDCDDTNNLVYPGAAEGFSARPSETLAGDGLDNDCDGTVDEGTDLYDDDGDGYSEEQGDCNDLNDAVSPAEIDVPRDYVDNDCNGEVDDDPPLVDNDGDGYANEDADGNPLDCDDTDADINPGAEEIPGDEVDENCDGALDVDADGDGSPSLEDCDDTNPEVSPDLEEVLGDGLDNNCNGEIDEGFEGPGVGCGALGDIEGVSFSCATVDQTGERRGPIGAWFLLLGLLPMARGRRRQD